MSNPIVVGPNAVVQAVVTVLNNGQPVPPASIVSQAYASSDTTLATVDANGLVTCGANAGNVTIAGTTVVLGSDGVTQSTVLENGFVVIAVTPPPDNFTGSMDLTLVTPSAKR